MMATPIIATTVPAIALMVIFSLRIYFPIGKWKIGVNAINVEAIPTLANCTATSESQKKRTNHSTSESIIDCFWILFDLNETLLKLFGNNGNRPNNYHCHQNTDDHT